MIPHPFPMKKHGVCLLCTSVILAGCSGTLTSPPTVESRLENPLYAERYWEELVDRMVEIQIQENDRLEEDSRYAAIVEAVRSTAYTQAQAARKSRQGTMRGGLMTIKELTQGQVLLKDGMLYLSPDFVTYPGPELRLYLTTVVDPRDVPFPDPASIDLGPLQTPYGEQRYTAPIPEGKKEIEYRTAVLWDTKLRRLYAFAQLGV